MSERYPEANGFPPRYVPTSEPGEAAGQQHLLTFGDYCGRHGREALQRQLAMELR